MLSCSWILPAASLASPSLSTTTGKRLVDLTKVPLTHPTTIPAEDTPEDFWAALLGSPSARDVFFRDHYGRSTVHVDRSRAQLSSPLPPSFDLKMFYDACDFINLRHQGSRDLLDKSQTSLRDLEGYIEEGGSAVISMVEPETNEFYDLKQSLEASVGHQLSFNIYHSGPNGTALLPHYDSYDVFVLQLEGQKTWDIELNNNNNNDINKIEPYALTLHPGDLLYMPQGVVHSAKTATGFASTTHLTIGIEKPRTWY